MLTNHTGRSNITDLEYVQQPLSCISPYLAPSNPLSPFNTDNKSPGKLYQTQQITLDNSQVSQEQGIQKAFSPVDR